jgi:biopolymer transport protein ExbD
MASAEVGGDTGGGGVEASESSVMGDINVTPLVDVMLVLLIIFMIVTPAIMAGFQAQLPEGAHLKARRKKRIGPRSVSTAKAGGTSTRSRSRRKTRRSFSKRSSCATRMTRSCS